jgi:hypothetical protein
VRAHQWTGSKIDLGMHCLYWARPEVKHPHRPPGAAAQRGINVHKASDCAHRREPLPPLDAVESAMFGQLRSWLSSRAEPDYSETVLLYDAENDSTTFGMVGETERDYLGVSPMTIPMRLDLAWAGPVPTVIDIKTGSRSNMSPAAENLQIATQGLAMARLCGAKEARVGLVFALQTKVHEDMATLGADELDAHAGMLHKRLRALPTAEPVRGSHCWRCPIGPTRDDAATCPAWASEETQ